MKPPRKTYLHVGLEKAASTTIQNFLESQYEALLTRGVLFPRSVFTRKVPEEPERTSGHLELIRNLVDGDISAFEAELDASDADTLFLSAENLFHYGNTAHLKLLADLLLGSDITLLVVLRRQDAWLRSYYVESVTNGWNAETGSINRFADRMIREGRLDYLALLARMQDVFAPTEIRVLHHDTLREGRGVIANFCQVAGLDFSDQDYAGAPRSHTTQTFPEAIEAHRRLNLLAAGFWSTQMHEWARGQRARAQEAAQQFQAPVRALVPDQPQRQAISTHVWAGNDTISRQFMNGAPFAVDWDWTHQPEVDFDETLIETLWDEGLAAFLDIRQDAPAMRAKAHLPDRFPLPLRLDKDVALRVNAAVAQARVILTYSAGATTQMAAARANRLVYCVTRDTLWGVDLQYRMDQMDLPTTPMVYHPESGGDQYASAIWQETFFHQPDLVLIDGELRAACLMAVALQTRAPVTVLFDDFENCKDRTRIESLILPVGYCGGMAEFHVQPMPDTDIRDRFTALLQRVTTGHE